VEVAGDFSCTGLIFGNYVLANWVNNYDVFIVKYDNLGNVLWAKCGGGFDADFCTGVTIDGVGNTYMTGGLRSYKTPFLNDTLQNMNSGFDDFFIAKIGPVCMTINSSTNKASCMGGNDGSASQTVSNGVPPYNYQWSNGQTTSAITGLTAGNYSVMIADAGGCSLSNFVTVNQAPAISAIMNITDASSCSANDGKIASTISGGTPAYNYMWSIGDTTATITGLYQGTYTLSVSDANSCAKTFTATVSCPSSAPDYDLQNGILIFPAPFSTSATFQITNDKLNNQDLEFTLYDIYGKAVKNFIIPSLNFRLDRGNLPAGLYFYRLAPPPSGEGRSEVATGKIIIE
jgi:hypothetical protein